MKPNKSKQVPKKTFIAVEEKKKDAVKHQIDINKKLKVTDFLGKIMLLSGIVAGVSYFLVQAAINSWSISYNTGDVATPYGWVIARAISFAVLGLAIFAIMHTVVQAKAGKDIRDRVNEALELNNAELRYVYERGKTAAQKEVITIPVHNTEISYEAKAKRLLFTGNISVKHIHAVEGNRKMVSESINKFVIYDYFDPSVHLALQKCGISIQCENDAGEQLREASEWQGE